MSEIPFTTREAYARGLGRGVLEGPRFRRVWTGVYVPSGTPPDLGVRVAAARRVLPADAVAVGATALWLHGVTIGAQPSPLRFATSHRHQVRRPGLAVVRVSGPVPAVDGVATPEHAFLTAATERDLVELTAAGDWLVRLGLSTSEQLRGQVAPASGRGVRRARRAAELVRDRVDSPRETRLRLCLVLAGLPEPRCNVAVGGAGRRIGHVDLLYEAYRLVLEYDGDQHRTDLHQWNLDIARMEDLAAAGYRVLRVTSAQLRRPYTLVLRTYAALTEAGYRGPEPKPTSEWRELFLPTAR